MKTMENKTGLTLPEAIAIVEQAEKDTPEIAKEMQKAYYKTEMDMQEFCDKYGVNQLTKAIIALR